MLALTYGCGLRSGEIVQLSAARNTRIAVGRTAREERTK
jgi:hypothetical protein